MYHLRSIKKEGKISKLFSNENRQLGLKDIKRVGTECKNEFFKFVGVHLDKNLNWNHHTKSVKNKAFCFVKCKKYSS